MEHFKTFKEYDKRYKVILKNSQYYKDEELFYSFMYDFKTFFYKTIHGELAPFKDKEENENFIRYYCNYINERILPICYKKIDKLKELVDFYKIHEPDYYKTTNDRLQIWLMLEDDFYALTCFRNIKNFAFYLERNRVPKLRVWDKTMHLFESLFSYAQDMILDNKVDRIRASYFPGAGKSYAGNIICAFWFGYDISMTILRITYSDDLVHDFTGKIQSIMGSAEYKKVFPYFNKPDKDLYKTKNSDTIWLKDSVGVNFYARTRDGQSTGKRARLIMIDDITKGQEEAYNVKLHASIVTRYDTDWTSRADSDDLKEIILGTMWSRFDLLNIIQLRDEEDSPLIKDETHIYTITNKDKTCIYISVPALDYETDETTCPDRYSTDFFRKKRSKMTDKALFNAVYQQLPEEPEDLIFGFSRLNTYTEATFPKEILEGNYECKAMIDPNRKGFDYFVVLFLKRYELKDNTYSKWFLCDIVFKKKQFKQIKEIVIDKIIKNNVSKLGVEINTSTELPSWIKELLNEKGYRNISIIEEYSTQNKEEKIASQQDEIINEIVYPAKGMFDGKSEMGEGMTWFTTYSISGKNEHDDFPDCMAMFTKLFVGTDVRNTTKILPSTFRL